MKAVQCRCGERHGWTSGMPIHDCQGCHQCGTTLAYGPKYHREIKPHKPMRQYDRSTGEFSHYVCSDCLARCDENGKEIPRTPSNPKP